MSNKSEIQANNADIQTLINKAKALPDYVDTTDGTASANNITKNKTAYVNGQKLTGQNPFDFDGIMAIIDAVEINDGLSISTEGCSIKTMKIKNINGNNELVFDENPVIITSTDEIEEGSTSPYPENSLYVVYKEG